MLIPLTHESSVFARGITRAPATCVSFCQFATLYDIVSLLVSQTWNFLSQQMGFLWKKVRVLSVLADLFVKKLPYIFKLVCPSSCYKSSVEMRNKNWNTCNSFVYWFSEPKHGHTVMTWSFSFVPAYTCENETVLPFSGVIHGICFGTYI